MEIPQALTFVFPCDFVVKKSVKICVYLWKKEIVVGVDVVGGVHSNKTAVLMAWVTPDIPGAFESTDGYSRYAPPALGQMPIPEEIQ